MQSNQTYGSHNFSSRIRRRYGVNMHNIRYVGCLRTRRVVLATSRRARRRTNRFPKSAKVYTFKSLSKNITRRISHSESIQSHAGTLGTAMRNRGATITLQVTLKSPRPLPSVDRPRERGYGNQIFTCPTFHRSAIKPVVVQRDARERRRERENLRALAFARDSRKKELSSYDSARVEG